VLAELEVELVSPYHRGVSGDLEAIKQRVKPRILGCAGVHGVGVRTGAVAVYLDRSADSLPDDVMTVLQQAAAPWTFSVDDQHVRTHNAPSGTGVAA
jgi:hypothetical protein